MGCSAILNLNKEKIESNLKSCDSKDILTFNHFEKVLDIKKK